jgi:hypothetical protein
VLLWLMSWFKRQKGIRSDKDPAGVRGGEYQ